MTNDLEARARALLGRWHDAKPTWRRSPGSLDISAVRETLVRQAVLQLVVETRQVEVVSRTRTAAGADTPSCHPWKVRIELPPEAPVGTEVRVDVSHDISVGCARCNSRGHRTCGRCRGNRKVRRTTKSQDWDTVPCRKCGATGRTKCKRCSAIGRVVGRVEVVARVEERVYASVVPDPEHPSGLSEALRTPMRGGAVLVSHTAADLEGALDVKLREGYRSHDESGLAVLRVLEDLVAEADGRHVRRVLVEVRHAPALALDVSPRRSWLDMFSLRIIEEVLWIWDEPPSVAPMQTLEFDSTAKGRFVSLGVLGAAIAAASAAGLWLAYG